MTTDTTPRGTFPVLCTPFRDDGAIDEADFDRLVDFVVGAGAEGCVYPGVASEVGELSAEERAGMVARLGAGLAGRIPFIVGASDDDPAAVAAHMEAGRAAGAVMAMVMAPQGAGPDTASQIGFFRAVAQGSPLPVMLQNASHGNGAALSPQAVAEIARAVPAIRAVKEETMPCGQNLTRIAEGCGEAIDGVFGGAGGRYITDELARGSLGTMPAAELTDLHVALLRAWRAGRRPEARALFRDALPALNFQAVFRMHMTKETLRRRGVLRHTHVRAAGPRMDDGDRAELAALLDQLAPRLDAFPLRAAA
ncbi:MAG: dihydrodipicolinate synthase family protein [Pseudomonadota bacterium]